MTPRRERATLMAAAANRLLDSLSDEQRVAATWPFPADDERTLWFYTPTDHGGLPLGAMDPIQHQRTHQLVATGLSTAGYVTAAAIMGLENILDHIEGWVVEFGRPRGRDPLAYWVAIFGQPDEGASWGWRFGGHHISLNVTVLDGEVVGTTPLFFGADPASAPLLGPHPHRPLAGAEDLGRELVRSLTPDQLARAVATDTPPVDLVGVNRTVLREGDRSLPLPLVWRGRLEDELDAAMARAQAAAEATLGITDADAEAVAFSTEPKGLASTELSTDQHEVLRALLAVYLNRLPDDLADAEEQRVLASIDELRFLWAGGREPGQAHYYRLQSRDLFVEYDNTQRDVNHIHTVWRDLRLDFGRDALAEHYAYGHPH